MQFNPLVPELYVIDFQKSLNFYTQILGFSIEYQRENPLFAFLSYQESQLMIQLEEDNADWHNGKPEYPFGRGINFQIRTDNAETLLHALHAHAYPVKRDLQESWYATHDGTYGYKEFLVMDPDGYLLRFSQPIGKK